MKATAALWFVSVFLVGALAGCVGGSADKGSTPGGDLGGPAFDESTGSVTGSVLTEEIAPIAGAQVGILGLPITATTDEAGLFSLKFVPPGKQTVSVIALGYQSTSKVVEVVAGQEATSVRFTLTALPSLAPYHVTTPFKPVVTAEIFKLTPDCMYPVPGQATIKTCAGGGGCPSNTAVSSAPPGCTTEMQYGHCGDTSFASGTYAKYGCDLTPEWKTILGELQWTPQSGVTGRGWIFEILAPNITRSGSDSGSVDQSDKHDWFAISSKSPIRHRIDDATMAEGSPSGTTHPIDYPNDRCGGKSVQYPRCNWAWRVFAGWCTINALSGGAWGCEKTGMDFGIDPIGQPVNVYFTYFIREPAPEGWTALPDQ